MRKLWHSLFGHGRDKGVAYGLVQHEGVLYTTVPDGRYKMLLKQSTDGGSTWTEATDSPAPPYRWSPEDNG